LLREYYCHERVPVDLDAERPVIKEIADGTQREPLKVSNLDKAKMTLRVEKDVL
jgi:hypothetical protein